MSKRSAQRHRQERREREGERHLDQMEVKALDAVAEIVERKVGTGRITPTALHSPASIFSSIMRWTLTGIANEPGVRATQRIGIHGIGTSPSKSHTSSAS